MEQISSLSYICHQRNIYLYIWACEKIHILKNSKAIPTHFIMETIYLSFYSNFCPSWDRYQDELHDVLLLTRKLLSVAAEKSTATPLPSLHREPILNQDICSRLKSIVTIKRVHYSPSLSHRMPFSTLQLQCLLTVMINFFDQIIIHALYTIYNLIQAFR